MTLKKIAAMATLLCAGYTHAAINDIVVTTTLDEDKDDNQCSLREAITLINQKLASSAAGYHGCGGASGRVTGGGMSLRVPLSGAPASTWAVDTGCGGCVAQPASRKVTAQKKAGRINAVMGTWADGTWGRMVRVILARSR